MTPILEARQVSKSYSQGPTPVKILDHLNFSLFPQQTVSIVGKSGSGKSTLLSLLAGLDNPTEGSVWFGERNLATLSQNELSRLRATHLGIVFQQYFLIPSLTALENIAIPLDILKIPGSEKRARDLLEMIGMSSRADHFPNELSGGECQRVAIGRAMATRPSLILADEPTGSLDQETGKQITQLLFDLANNEQLTLIVVTHNSELAAKCQRRLVLSGGTLIDGIITSPASV